MLLLCACGAGIPARAEDAAQTVSLTDSRSGAEITFSERDTVVLSEGQSHTFSLTAPARGEYWLSVCYRAIPGRQINPEAAFTLTGENIQTQQSIYFARRWVDIHTDKRFQKDSNGNEVDLVILRDGVLTLVECKAGMTYDSGDVRSFSRLEGSDYAVGPSCILCLTEKAYPIKDGVYALPISSI